MNKRIIFEQADDVVSQVDVLVETYIAANQDHQDRIRSVNAIRESWLKEIRECESYNILHCRENEVDMAPLQRNDLFKKFCLLIEMQRDVLVDGRFTWRLLVIPNFYLSQGQIACFQELMRIVEYTENERVPVSRSSFEKLFVNIRSNFYVR
jgi:hypothetical protein